MDKTKIKELILDSANFEGYYYESLKHENNEDMREIYKQGVNRNYVRRTENLEKYKALFTYEERVELEYEWIEAFIEGVEEAKSFYM